MYLWVIKDNNNKSDNDNTFISNLYIFTYHNLKHSLKIIYCKMRSVGGYYIWCFLKISQFSTDLIWRYYWKKLGGIHIVPYTSDCCSLCFAWKGIYYFINSTCDSISCIAQIASGHQTNFSSIKPKQSISP